MSLRKYVCFLFVSSLLLVSCTTPTQQKTLPTNTPKSTPSMTVTQMSSQPPPTVGPIPNNCPVSNPSPRTISPNLAPVIGATPVWATWIPGPSIFHGPSPHSTDVSTYAPGYGWQMTKVVWEVGPNYTHLITIRGHDLFDNTPLLLQFRDEKPTANAILDPQHPDHPVSVVGDNWAEWGSYIVVPKAGCYSLEVSWPTGHWNITFAFGV